MLEVYWYKRTSSEKVGSLTEKSLEIEQIDIKRQSRQVRQGQAKAKTSQGEVTSNTKDLSKNMAQISQDWLTNRKASY